MALPTASRMLRGWLLLCLVSAPVAAGLQIAPHSATLVPGGSCAFSVSGQQEPAATDWRWSITGPGAMDARTGVYTAPPLEEAAKVRVHAVRDADPDVRCEASIVVLPLPSEPFELVTQVLGDGWVEPFSGRLPFLDLETGARMTDEAVREGEGIQHPRIWAGHGLPFTLAWNPVPGAQTLLSYREGGDVVRRDVTGQGSQVILPRGRIDLIRVEALLRNPEGVWDSQVQTTRVEVRGVHAFAGNPVAGPGHRDGTGLAARFAEPFGVASIQRFPWGKVTFLVTDRRDHVVRIVNHTGGVGTLCGEPGQAGHRDSPTWFHRLRSGVCGTPSRKPLFDSPTYLAIRHRLERDGAPWEALVSDSGNHVLRLVQPDGSVSTLAGTPRQPGYRDADDPALAAFRDPQGVAWDPADGKVYVADRGNRVIRVIEPSGRVSTLAGTPQCAGSRDGVGTQAGFIDLKDLCLPTEGDGAKALYVLDGHALRRVALPGGEVTTVLGVVDQPGWREIQQMDGEARLAAARTPCLNDPTGLLPWAGGLFIVDHGNHAVRVFAFSNILFTKAGGPHAGGRTRWGLLPDRMKGPLDDVFAALDGPWTVAYALYGLDSPALVTTTGSSLGEIHHAGESVDDLSIRDAGIHQPVEGGPPVLHFTLRALDPDRNPVRRAVDYVVELLDSEGKSITRTQGRAAGGDTVGVSLEPLLTELQAVVIRCTTDQGWSAGGKFEVVGTTLRQN